MEQTKTAEQLYKGTLESIASWSDEMTTWTDAGIRAREVAKMTLKEANQYRNPVAVTIGELVLTPDHFACIVEHPELYTGSLCAKCNQHWDGISKCKRETPTVAPSYSAQALAEEAWRMLPDSCKEIMKGSVEQTWKESLVADIEHAFKTKTPQ